MATRRARWAALLAGLAVLGPLAVIALGADALPPTRCADASAITRSGDWEAVRGPRFTTRPGGRGQDISAFAVHPSRPSVRFATNGTSVERTDDGGCRWREVWSLPDVPSEEDTLAVATSVVAELVLPLDARAHDRLVLLLRDNNGGPRVFASVDGGREEPFRDRSEGLPPTGTPTDLLIAATNPDFYFLSVRGVAPGNGGPGGPLPLPTLPPLPLPGSGGSVSPTSVGALYGSVDAGGAWEMRLDTDDLGGSTAGLDVLAGHPTAPNRLWAVADGILRSSTDGGRTFRGPGPTPAQQRDRSWQVTALAADELTDAAGVRSGEVVVLGFSATSAQGGGPITLASKDGGATYDEERASGVADAISPFLQGSGSFATSTRAASGRPAQVQLIRLGAGRAPMSVLQVGPPTSAASLAVTTDRSVTPTFHARAGATLLRYVGPAAAVPPALPPVIGGVIADGIAPLGAAVLTPSRDAVVMPVGTSRTVPHTLMTPRRLTPLDLYLLVDTSISMADDLDRVRADLLELVRQLKGRGLDLSVGLGEFKGGESSVAYRRVTGVGPSLPDLARGLAALEPDGFGLEAQLIGMEQALDGLGEGPDALIPAPCKFGVANPDRFVQQERRTAPLVIRGQQADFRAGAVPVVLVVTDTNFLRPAGTRLKPDCSVDVDSVAAGYARRGVHVVGLGVDDIDNAPRAADLTYLARQTGALQPPGPACAPLIDPTQGAPAVCRTATALLPTLERLASQQREPAVLDVVEAPDSEVISAVPASFTDVDLRRARPLALPVTYSCVDVPAGRYDAAVDVQLVGVTLARVTATVTCVAAEAALPPVAVVVVAVPPLLGLLPLPVPPPPPPPPGQVVQPQVQTQPQPNPQVQSGTQEEQQQQLEMALALQSGVSKESEVTMAMSAREPVVPRPVFLTVIAAMSMGAAGLAMRQQRRAPVYVRAGTGR